MNLRYLYIGVADTETEVPRWLAVPGASLRWRFQHFGADVAAIDPGSGPAVLLADHRPTGSVLPIFAVEDLDVSMAAMEEGGWTSIGRMGTPEGMAGVLRDPGGTLIALLCVERPQAMEQAYLDPPNEHAVGSDGLDG